MTISDLASNIHSARARDYLEGIVYIAKAKDEQVKPLVGKLRSLIPESYLKRSEILEGVEAIEGLVQAANLDYDGIRGRANTLMCMIASYEVSTN